MVRAPGSRLAQYEILSALGSGGMGVVYRARDTRLGREVALKVMAPHIASDPAMRARFETEVRAVAALAHPGILSFYELGVSDGIPFAVMEVLEGRNLRERLEGGPLPWREAAGIAAGIADGLCAAHAQGVVHRDLKPENVFLTSEGCVKILDFGLAERRTGLAGGNGEPAAAQSGSCEAHAPCAPRRDTGLVGTFGYMAPEQVTGAAVDGRTDIFTLGCLLYEMLAGAPLFPGRTPREAIDRLLEGTAPDDSRFDPAAPGGLRAIVARCTEPDASRRFQSAGDVSAALNGLLIRPAS